MVTGGQVFYEATEGESDEQKPNHLIIALSSDRHVCYGTHFSIAKTIWAHIGGEQWYPDHESRDRTSRKVA